MQHDPRVLLADIVQEGEHILFWVEDMDYEAFAGDIKTQNAVKYSFANIGEALNKLHRSHPEIAERVPEFRKVISFRNLLPRVFHRAVRIGLGVLPGASTETARGNAGIAGRDGFCGKMNAGRQHPCPAGRRQS